MDVSKFYYDPSCLIFKCAHASINGIQLEIYRGSILDSDKIGADCIVNAANENLAHNGGLAGTIASLAGASLENECRLYIQRNGKLRNNEALATTAGNLTMFKKVIHVAGPIVQNGYLQNWHIEQLTNCVFNVLNRANSLQLTCVAIPGISCGIFGFPKKEAAQCHLGGFHKFVEGITGRNDISYVKRVQFILFTAEEISEFNKEYLRRSEMMSYDCSNYIGLPIEQQGALMQYCGGCSGIYQKRYFRIDRTCKLYCDFCVYRYTIRNCFTCKEMFAMDPTKIYCRICKKVKDKIPGCCQQCNNICADEKQEICSYCEKKIIF